MKFGLGLIYSLVRPLPPFSSAKPSLVAYSFLYAHVILFPDLEDSLAHGLLNSLSGQLLKLMPTLSFLPLTGGPHLSESSLSSSSHLESCSRFNAGLFTQPSNGDLQGGLKASSDTLAITAIPVPASTTPPCSIKH